MPMPTKSWEPPPYQHDPGRQSVADSSDQPGNFDREPDSRGADRDADGYEQPQVDGEDINTNGSER
jgi:hypothetical protein